MLSFQRRRAFSSVPHSARVQGYDEDVSPWAVRWNPVGCSCRFASDRGFVKLMPITHRSFAMIDPPVGSGTCSRCGLTGIGIVQARTPVALGSASKGEVVCRRWNPLARAAGVRRGKVVLVPWVRDPSWRAVGPPGSSRSRSGGNERSRAFDEKGGFCRSASVRAVTRSERRASLENANCGSRPSVRKGKATSHEPRQPGSCGSAGAMTMARHKGIDTATREIRCGDRCWDDRPVSREGMTGPHRKSERLVVPMKRGNARGGKGPHFGPPHGWRARS